MKVLYASSHDASQTYSGGEYGGSDGGGYDPVCKKLIVLEFISTCMHEIL